MQLKSFSTCLVETDRLHFFYEAVKDLTWANSCLGKAVTHSDAVREERSLVDDSSSIWYQKTSEYDQEVHNQKSQTNPWYRSGTKAQ